MPASSVPLPRRARLPLLGVAGAVALAVALVASAGGCAGGGSAVETARRAATAPAGVVISQVYGGGGNAGAYWKSDFVELHNRGASPAALGGLTLQYASAAGTTWQAVALAGTISPGGFFLVKLATGTGGVAELPAADATGALLLGASAGKVALVVGAGPPTCHAGCAAPNLLDLVGYGGATLFEGSGPAPALGNAVAARRRGDGGEDSDDNAADFAVARSAADGPGEIDPRHAGSPAVVCPAAPADAGAVPGSPPDATPDAAPAALTPIAAIQGAAHLSPLRGAVVTTRGIVTARLPDGFFLEDPRPDADDATSEAIFVFTGAAPPAAVEVGASLEVRGPVVELRPGCATGCPATDPDFANLTSTQIARPTAIVALTGDAALPPLPPPVRLGPGGRVPPAATIEDDAQGDVEAAGAFDPASDGLDFHESLEAMRVQIEDAVAVGPTSGFGEIPVLAAGGAGAGLRTPRGGILLRAGDPNPERLVLDDVLVPTPRVSVGDVFPGPVVGVVSYAFGRFRILPTAPLPAVRPAGLARETVAFGASPPGLFTVAAFNVENLDAADPQEKFDALAAVVVTNLGAPDLLALEEIQDDNGPKNDAVVSADATIAKLVAAIAAAGGPAYAYRGIDPEDDRDGGEPGGNIRTAFLFRSDRGLRFVDRPGATATTATGIATVDGRLALSHSPGRIDPTNVAFANSRKPLAAELEVDGARIFVVANHWNSKGGDGPLFGRFQPPARPTEAQRRQQAEVVAGFVEALLAADRDAHVIVLGDLNDFPHAPPVQRLVQAGLRNLVETLPEEERYTYVFEGNAQALDHLLVSPRLFARTAGFDVVHVNAELVDQTSDHDPAVAAFDLAPPAIEAAPPREATATSGAGASVPFAAPAARDGADGPVPVTCAPAPGALFPPGATSVTCAAADRRGNQAAISFPVRVTFDAPAGAGFFLPPLGWVPSWRRGWPIPVRFRLAGPSAAIADLDARLYLRPLGPDGPGGRIEAVDVTGAAAGNRFRHDRGTRQYVFLLATGGLAPGAFRLEAELGDGVPRTIDVALRP